MSDLQTKRLALPPLRRKVSRASATDGGPPQRASSAPHPPASRQAPSPSRGEGQVLGAVRRHTYPPPTSSPRSNSTTTVSSPRSRKTRVTAASLWSRG